MNSSSSMLGANASTNGSVAASTSSQSSLPASLSGSGTHMSSDVTGPAARTRSNISRSCAPPSAYMRGIRGG
jgi:hypothetical protein